MTPDDNSFDSNCSGENKGGVLIEVLIALLIFMTSSAYLLSSEIKTRVLWQATLKSQDEQIQLSNTTRLAYTQDAVDQHWEDIAVFGIPTITP
ncbi:hypothetical protein D1814_14200 [Alteromonas sp. BL110]|nr:hypothetical protein D1814_14200 [Alteromonas sp. BL110]RKM82347.1 hypothetical protein D7031_05350 [Alteromonas sp. BL110]